MIANPGYTAPMAEIQRLLDIMARLRDPERGCPWDLEQDFATISPHTIEEAYEVDEAIERGDPEALRDELGDLLFQVVFQARIAQEKGLFDWDGVVEAISEKLVRRHPHVFAAAESPAGSAAQLAHWEAIKAAERAAAAPEGEAPDPFEGIPRRLPALARSAKVSGRLARLGDAESTRLTPTERSRTPRDHRAAIEAQLAAIDALCEEDAAGAPSPSAALVEALGAGLQAWARLARSLGIDPEQALRTADDRTMRCARGD
jgi:ATP diphosphatase